MTPTQDTDTALILAVDDTPTNLVILERALRAPKYNTIRAAGGQEALAVLSQQKPDLVLLDIMMPDVDGFAVRRAMLKNPEWEAIPVIFLTALEDTKYLREAFALGAVDYITKPFHVAELEARVKTHLEIGRLRGKLEVQVAKRTAELVEALEKLECSNREILNRLSLASEYRDNETSNHLKRMSRYSVCIGRAAGLSEIMLNNLSQASMMHDAGKIGIPDAILLKPGKLTDEEFQIMKNHPKIGYQLLSGIDSEMIQMAASIALTHHEKFDGSGYPQGLKGEDIPVAGRIVAIADVFDALTTNRPYKHAWPLSEAREFIHNGSGTHFDPHLVAHFESVIAEITAIYAEFSDLSI